MTIEGLILALVFLPLFASLLVGVFVRSITPALAQAITCGAMVISATLAGILFMDFANIAASHEGWQALIGGHGLVYKAKISSWIEVGDFKANWTLRVDAITAIMLIVVTWVSTVVHIYSVGYMSHDDHQPRFMAYLSLFTFCMLMLVTADNLVQLFMGWEGVGLASYLLIGFWFKKPSANKAAMKAFLVNRVGDFGFALGIFAIFVVFDSVQFDDIFADPAAKASATMTFFGHDFHALTLISILLFIGAMGKSAQLGLHTWLPDAMEGPTPVSALIHAATMVTAGVFMVCRMSPLFEQAPDALTLVTIIGALTAFFAASVGLVQNDIKRVIAYSTCSQLGYMFFAAGVGAYSAAMFHLMTHAFFKALLFLGAGSVIHGMSGEQDMRNMGGVWKKLPYTYACMWIGSLALAGLPFFAGYYSKDMILEAAYGAHTKAGLFAFWMGIAAAFMTAFYSWRLLFMTFHGKPRASHEVMHHVHESPPIMLRPLILLVLGSLFAGAIGYHALHLVDGHSTFWQGTIASHEAIEKAHHAPAWVGFAPLVVALSGIALAFFFYIKQPTIPAKIAEKFPRLYQFLLNKWYFDELYDFLFVNPAKKMGQWLWKFFDEKIIDGLGPNGSALATHLLAGRVSRLQTGYVYHYAFAILLGVLAALTFVVVR